MQLVGAASRNLLFLFNKPFLAQILAQQWLRHHIH
jgi:hypothetical protein